MDDNYCIIAITALSTAVMTLFGALVKSWTSNSELSQKIADLYERILKKGDDE